MFHTSNLFASSNGVLSYLNCWNNMPLISCLVLLKRMWISTIDWPMYIFINPKSEFPLQLSLLFVRTSFSVLQNLTLLHTIELRSRLEFVLSACMSCYLTFISNRSGSVGATHLPPKRFAQMYRVHIVSPKNVQTFVFFQGVCLSLNSLPYFDSSQAFKFSYSK